MELIKFNPTTYDTSLEFGTPIEGATTKVWIERYREPGEFKLKAPLSSNLKAELPVGAIISHVNTLEAMFVENHVITESEDEGPMLEISGRSLEAFLEHRVVGSNKNWGSHDGLFDEYVISANTTDVQAIDLINDHIYTSLLSDTDDALEDVYAINYGVLGGTSEARTIKRVNVHKALLDLLSIDDLGVRVVKRNHLGGGFNSPNDTIFIVHDGNDVCDTVIFSEQSGDITSADYLWSIKALKNSALITSNYLETVVVGTEAKYDRRWMLVDASDLDDHLDAEPSGATLTSLLARMVVRGQEALAAQNEVIISRSEISKHAQYRYRFDYDIGDIVSLDGSYGEIEKRRVTEYTEIEDENGEIGFPTLGVLST